MSRDWRGAKNPDRAREKERTLMAWKVRGEEIRAISAKKGKVPATRKKDCHQVCEEVSKGTGVQRPDLGKGPVTMQLTKKKGEKIALTQR